MQQNATAAGAPSWGGGGAYSAPQTLLAGFKGLLRGRRESGEGMEGERREEKGMSEAGREGKEEGEIDFDAR